MVLFFLLVFLVREREKEKGGFETQKPRRYRSPRSERKKWVRKPQKRERVRVFIKQI